MKIPKYVEEALHRRTKAARAWMDADYTITRFIFSNELDKVIDSEDFGTGVESIINPEDSSERIRQAILNTDK